MKQTQVHEGGALPTQGSERLLHLLVGDAGPNTTGAKQIPYVCDPFLEKEIHGVSLILRNGPEVVVNPLAKVPLILKVKIYRHQDERRDVHAEDLPTKLSPEIAEVGAVSPLFPERGWELVTVYAIRRQLRHTSILDIKRIRVK
jgi:hypothetical protein